MTPDTWIVAELSHLEATCKKIERKDRVDIALFNDLFAEFVTEASGYQRAEGTSYWETSLGQNVQ